MLKVMWLRFWYRVMIFAIRRGETREFGVCANRTWRKTMFGPLLEVTLGTRRLSERDGYSREELYEMLKTVRIHEELQEWKVPEPFGNSLTPEALAEFRDAHKA